MIQTGKKEIKFELAVPPQPKQGKALARAARASAYTMTGVVANVSGGIQLSDQDCQNLIGQTFTDHTVVYYSKTDAIQQLQTASDGLNAVRGDYQRLDLTQPNISQLNSDLNTMSAALVAWQQDHDQALAAVTDATRNLQFCSKSSVTDENGLGISDYAGWAQSEGAYFTDPNVLLQVAALNQQFQTFWQMMVAAVQEAQQKQQAQIELAQQVQGLSGQLSSCIAVQGQWWGVQLILDENCTQTLEGLLQKVLNQADAYGLAAKAVSILASGPSAILTTFFWVLAIIEAALVNGAIVSTDKGNGVTINISWIPLGATLLADMVSAGTATPELVNLVEMAEQATLFADNTNPGSGSQWYSFFWFTAN
jgi:hypothetical protein